MIAIDASALVDAVTNSHTAESIDWHLAHADAVSAPDLIHVEVASALWRMVRAGDLDDEQARAALDRTGSMGITTWPNRGLAQMAWAFREHVRITDGFYLACAQVVGGPLLTTDARLARGHHGVPVTLVT